MKDILISQRVFENITYLERRDALDQAWFSFLERIQVKPIIIPNHFNSAKNFTNFDGLLLTGGNDIDKDAPERDQVERYLLEVCRKRGLPVIGVCRGMQLILKELGAKLVSVENHVGRHLLDNGREVNSFHNYGFKDVPAGVEVLARSQDGLIESIHYENLWGIMWHPERELPPDNSDIEFFKKVYRL